MVQCIEINKNKMVTDVMLGRLQYTGVFWVCNVKSGRWTAHVYQIPRCHNQQNYNMNFTVSPCISFR